VIVVDAAAVVDVLLGTTRGETAYHELARHDVAHAPHLIDVEVLHALRRWTTQGRLDQRVAAAALETFESSLPLIRHPHRALWRRSWELRDRFSAYDATYVALAEVLDAPLLTADARLARGARGLVDVILAD
jgi:predicted nucleic acid-binding protein